MRYIIMHSTAVAVAVAFAGTSSVLADPPQLWTELTFTEAREKALEEDRVFLVYATASWCPPCRQMEQTTWQSEAVRTWFEEYGVAIKFDVDGLPNLARELEVKAMPTMIAYREGEAFDRLVGYKSDAELVSWLEEVRAGRRELDRLREAARERAGEDGLVDVHARLNLARALQREGALDEATQEYLWLWENMLDHSPSMYGVRLSFMISDMEQLAGRHGPAKEAFRKLRAQYQPRIVSGEAARDEVVDWVSLARVVDERQSLLKWFDTVKDKPDSRAMLMHGERELSELLIEEDRWADVAVLYRDPVSRAKRLIESDRRSMEYMDESGMDRMRAVHRRMMREQISTMYAVLLAAESDEEAEQVALLLLESDDTTAARGALVTTALRAGQARPRHLQWVDEAEEMGARTPRARRQLIDALGEAAR